VPPPVHIEAVMEEKLNTTFTAIVAASRMSKNMTAVEKQMREGKTMKAAIKAVYPDWSDAQVMQMMTKMKSGMASY